MIKECPACPRALSARGQAPRVVAGQLDNIGSILLQAQGRIRGRAV